MFHYNADSGRCKRFWYGGCQGNANLFETDNECMAACGNAEKEEKVDITPGKKNIMLRDNGED